jgi:hypothetical protein
MPAGAKLTDLNRFFAKPKTHQKTHLFKTAQNLKKHNHGRPRARFWSLFGTIWIRIFIKFRDPPQPLKLQQAWCKNTTFTTSGLSFWHRNSIENSCFFKTSFWTHFSSFFVGAMPKSSILGPLQNPLGCKMATKINTVVSKGS